MVSSKKVGSVNAYSRFGGTFLISVKKSERKSHFKPIHKEKTKGGAYLEQNDDRHLVERTLEGSTDAYTDLYEQTAGDLYKIVRFLLGNAEDAKDVIQETYLQAYRNLYRFDQSREFRPWLTGIALRQIKAHRRRHWLQLRKSKKAAQSEKTQEEDFAGVLTDRLSDDGLSKRINRLPYKLRQVVLLRYLNDYSQEEVAEILNIPLGTVKSRIHSALERLRRSEPALKNTPSARAVEKLHGIEAAPEKEKEDGRLKAEGRYL